MRRLTVVRPGLLSTVQDEGRFGYQRYGVPVSGAIDVYALWLANWCVGNDRRAAAIEMTVVGLHLRFHSDGWIALCGADMGATLAGETVPRYRSIAVRAGDELRCNGARRGARCYLAVAGGITVDPVLGSRSTYMRGGIGGFQGRALQAGDVLPIGSGDLSRPRVVPRSMLPDYRSSFTARVVWGPDEEAFTPDGRARFLLERYTVTPNSDRMGFHLQGSPIEHRGGADVLSNAINFGSIQVPGSGQPIVMMADRQTVGGYTKIAQVVSFDLPYVAQLKPGDTLSFRPVPLEVAHWLFRRRARAVASLYRGERHGVS